MNRKKITLLATLSIVLAGSGGLLLDGCARRASQPKPEEKKAAPKLYRCPMHPQIVRDRPGECPICGMKLVPIEEAAPAHGKAEGNVEDLSTVSITPERQQLLGVKTGSVTRGPFATSIRAVGRVAYDERRVHHIHTRYEAYVETISADFTGKFVKRGEELARLYSPELFATQQEYLLALRASRSLGGSGVSSVASGGHSLLEAARQRLLLWDISPGEIAALEKRGEPLRSVPIYSPISGYVTGRTAYHGMKVMPADSLFDIVDLSGVWVLADVYEYEAPRLAEGQPATMTLSYWPGRAWTGKVTYIYPAVDEKTRTLKVRLEFENAKNELKPEMFADVVIHGKARQALQMPDEAVLDSGTRKVVFVALGEGKLQPREVKVGDHAEGVYEVLSGVSEGERVVLGANFLVDSESRLKAALSAMTTGNGQPAPAPAATDHGSHQ